MADISSDNYYKVLGVDKTASDADLAKAYKRLALKHHPDKNPDRKEQAEEEFKKLTEAYDVLRCPEKRRLYDQCGRPGLRGENPQAGDYGFASGFGGQTQTNMSREHADQIFRTFFGDDDPFISMFGQGFGGGPSQFMFQTAGPGDDSGFHTFSPNSHFFEGMPFGQAFAGAPATSGYSSSTGARSQQANRSRSRRAPRLHAVPQGTTIVVHGLTKSPEYNGRLGRIVKWNEAQERYEVEVMSGDHRACNTTLLLRSQNLTQLCDIEVAGLEKKTEINGARGEICNFDTETCRYVIRVGHERLSLRPANCILSPGTRVVINGLSKTQWNGRMASIESVDRTAARYSVECEIGKRLKIKYENVLC